jgi:hypothetical protein
MNRQEVGDGDDDKRSKFLRNSRISSCYRPVNGDGMSELGSDISESESSCESKPRDDEEGESADMVDAESS